MYIELHARSAFSFLEGASAPEQLIATGRQLQMPAMALLDRAGVYGAARFHLAAQNARIKAHIGAEVTCESFSPRRLSVPLCLHGESRLPLLVATRSGHQNLCRLLTRMKLRAKKDEGAV